MTEEEQVIKHINSCAKCLDKWTEIRKHVIKEFMRDR